MNQTIGRGINTMDDTLKKERCAQINAHSVMVSKRANVLVKIQKVHSTSDVKEVFEMLSTDEWIVFHAYEENNTIIFLLGKIAQSEPASFA